VRGVLLPLAMLVAACQAEAPSLAPADMLAAPEERLAAARAACVAAGGTWGRDRRGAELCFRTPPDANAPCATSADCAGVCLARSRTCAPVVPLLGCNEVITSTGLRTELCVN